MDTTSTTGGRINLLPGQSKPVQHDPSTFAGALPTPLFETLGAALDNTAANEKYSSGVNVLQAQADKELTRIQKETGVALPNPYRYDPMIMNQDQAWEMWDKHVAKLAETNPTTRIPTRSDFEAMGAERQQSAAERNAAAFAGENSFSSDVARFVGEGIGDMSDPINLAANAAPGAAWSAGVLKQGALAILKEVGKVAGIGALTNIGAVAVTNPLDQLSVTKQFDMGRYVTNLALAGVFGAGFGGVVRGGGFVGEAALNRIGKVLETKREARVRFLQGLPKDTLTPEQQQALRIEERLLEREKGNPLGPTYEGDKQHGQRVDAQDKAISEGKLVPDNDPVSGEPFNQLEPFDQSVAEQLNEIGDNDTVNSILGQAGGEPAVFDTWVDGLRSSDKAEGETLGQYVQRLIDQADKYRPALRVHDTEALAEAAIMVDGKRYTGKSHADAIAAAHKAGAAEADIEASITHGDFGYITTKDRFVADADAPAIATKAGQQVTEHLSSDALVNFPLKVGDNSPRVLRGKRGQIHPEMMKDYGIPDSKYDEMYELDSGYYSTEDGRYYTRNEARAALQLSDMYQAWDTTDGFLGAMNLRQLQSAEPGQAGITKDMAKAVHEAGFSDRLLTPDELARLLEQEAAGSPMRKAGAQIVGEGGATLARQASVLDRLIPEWRTLKGSEVKARLTMLSEARQRQSGLAIKNPEEVMKERAAQAEAHNVQLDEELKPANQEQLNDLEGRAVTEQAMADPTEVVSFEREDGSIERMTIGEMLKRMSDQDREFSVISKCLVGGP